MNIRNYFAIFEALGHETRLKVFELIYCSGKAGVRPKDIIEKFGVDSGTLDFHLKRLVAVKLIVPKDCGRRGVYCASDDIPQEFVRLFDSSVPIGSALDINLVTMPGSPLELLH